MLHNGKKITIDGQEIIVPPISLGQLRNGLLAKLKEHDDLVNAGNTFEAYNIRGDVLLAAVRRNYPDFSEELLFDNLDMGNIGEIWLSVLGISGFTPGEDRGAAGSTNTTSDPSTKA
jgi:hypothetical protein